MEPDPVPCKKCGELPRYFYETEATLLICDPCKVSTGRHRHAKRSRMKAAARREWKEIQEEIDS